MQTKYKVIIGVVALVVAFAFGRYSAPESVHEVKETTETATKEKNKEKATEKHTHDASKVTVITKPDGTKEVTHEFTHDEDTSRKSSSNTSETVAKTDKEEKDITYKGSKLTLSALAGAKVNFSEPLTPAYGGMIQKEVLGPISVGAFGFSNGMAGVSVGVSF